MCRRVQGSQIFKQNWIISIHSRVIVILPIWIYVALVGGGCPGWSTIVYMSSGGFRGKESSNKIELSRLVQELSNFGVSGFLQLLGVGGWGWGVVVGCPPHMCTCTRMHTHACMVNMVISCKWPPHWIWGNPRDSLWCHTHVHAHVCMHVCTCVCVHVGGVHPLTTLHPHPPTPHPPESFKI